METTRHAARRLRQRGFPQAESLLPILQRWGHTDVAPGGVERTVFGSKEHARAIATMKHDIQQLDRIKGTVLIHRGARIITVYKH